MSVVGVSPVSNNDYQPVRCVTMKMNARTLSCLCIAALCGALVGDRAQAQSGYASAAVNGFRAQNSSRQFTSQRFQNQVRSRDVGRAGVPGVNLRTFGGGAQQRSNGGGAQQRSKPFKDLNRGPAVSPYLALSGSLNGVSDYYNVVRPQQRQAQANSQMQRQTRANSRQLNQMAAASPYNIQGDPYLAPTGHSSTYMNLRSFQSTGNYFPPPQGLFKRR
jgi:murein L,D-transpeptidase YcbB/YkuD